MNNEINDDNVELTEEGIKNELNKILEASKEIDKKSIAIEMLSWIKNNVENFIDNHERVFKLDLHFPYYVEEMKNTYALQELFKSIPEDTEAVEIDLSSVNQKIDLDSIDKDLVKKNLLTKNSAMEEIMECRSVLNGIVEDILSIIDVDEDCNELKNDIFNEMAFYYGIQAINNKGHILTKDIVGVVEIIDLNYDAFTMNVSVTPKEVLDEEGNVLVEAGEAVSYMIPESFSLTLEISFKEKSNLMPSLF